MRRISTRRMSEDRPAAFLSTSLVLAVKDAPIPRAVQDVGRILPMWVLNGLHHHYVRI
jgi:hypothetical protein